jgi:endonuclease/exonuclease/phosphatase (EEP) superfamily protein YafD
MDFLRGKLAVAAANCVGGLKRLWTASSWVELVTAAILGALVLASAAGVASGRISALAVFGSLQGHLAALALAVMLVALALRSRAFAVIAALMLAVNVGTVGVRVAATDTCAVQMAASGQRVLRVMTLNIRGENGDFAAIERALAQNRPDILLLQELRPHHAALLAQLRARYPNQIVCDVHPDCGIGVLSTYRIEPRQAIGEGPVMALEVTAKVEDHDLVLFATHLQRPFSGQGQAEQLQALAADVAALPANSVIAGDFNSAVWSAGLSRYVRGAGVCASNLTHATWPEWLGPFGVPIDHIFLKRGVRLLSIATVSGTGSDHKALLATISVL